MRLSVGPNSLRLGSVEIHETYRVTELDAGHRAEPSQSNAGTLDLPVSEADVSFSREALFAIERKLAIVVPCMNEEQGVLDGVLRGIPHDCLIILVSNSKPSNFEAECKLLAKFCKTAARAGAITYQGDPGLAQAFHAAGMLDLVTETGENGTLQIRNGKGEAMMIGTAISKLFNKHFVGFIDADNLVAGAVHEYCKVYAAGIHHALHHSHDLVPPHVLVRIKWNSKPKVEDGKLVFPKSGRCSRLVNEWFNRFSAAIHDSPDSSSVAPNLIQTANAGEHAMSLDLAMKLRFANGYAVEPFQLINVWEHFGAPAPTSISAAPNKVHVLQVETRNPHFHDVGKGSQHIEAMQLQGLSTLYHTRLAQPSFKAELGAFLGERFPRAVGEAGEPGQARVYPPMGAMDFAVFEAVLKESRESLKVFGQV